MIISAVEEHAQRIERIAEKARIRSEKKNKKVDHTDAEDVIAEKTSKGLLIIP